MNFFLIALVIFSYGAQTLFQTRMIPIVLLCFSLILLIFRKQKYATILCVCTLATVLLREVRFLEELWPASRWVCGLVTAALWLWPQSLNWFGNKSVFGKSFFSAIGVGVFSFVVVVAWVYLVRPSVDQIPFKIQPSWNAPTIAFIILIFAVINSFTEEFVYRGLTLEIMQKEASPFVANLAQSVAFGIMHSNGFPFGISGSVLAGCFAFFMGWLKQRSGSFLYPWIAHFTTNILMGYLLYLMTLNAMI